MIPAQMDLEVVKRALAERFDAHDKPFRCDITGPCFRSANSVIYRGECSGISGPFAVKCLRDGALLRQFDALTTVEKGLASSDDYGVPHPILRLEDENIIVMEWIEGEDLSRLLTRRAVPLALPVTEAESYLDRAGRWLARFHGIKPIAPALFPAAKRFGILDEAAGGVRLERHAAAQNALRVLRETSPEVGEELSPQGGVHGDYKPENVIFSKGRTVGIDVGMRYDNAVVFDLAYFITHLILLAWRPRGFSSGLYFRRDRLVAAFLAGYKAEGEPFPEAPLAWMRLYHLVRLHIRHQKSSAMDPMRRYWIFAIGRELGRALRDLEEAMATSR